MHIYNCNRNITI